MATVQILKKKLRGIRSTKKLTKAMKTASTVKYSQLNALYKECVSYQTECETFYRNYSNEFNNFYKIINKNAPMCLIIMASNKGMCGSFNNDIFSYMSEVINEFENPPYLLICGKQAQTYCSENGISFNNSFVFNDLPSHKNANDVLDVVSSLIKEGQISGVKIIYPEYHNMVKQTPVCIDFLPYNVTESNEEENNLYIPDKATVIKTVVEKVMSAVLFKYLLETALGAQAATLMTMRSAYDTATEYCIKLENEINRKRQTQVTADVIETSAEFTESDEKEE